MIYCQQDAQKTPDGLIRKYEEHEAVALRGKRTHGDNQTRAGKKQLDMWMPLSMFLQLDPTKRITKPNILAIFSMFFLFWTIIFTATSYHRTSWPQPVLRPLPLPGFLLQLLLERLGCLGLRLRELRWQAGPGPVDLAFFLCQGCLKKQLGLGPKELAEKWEVKIINSLFFAQPGQPRWWIECLVKRNIAS